MNIYHHHFTHDGLKLSYLDHPPRAAPGAIAHGTPILLIHGFASTIQVNWVNTLWVRSFVDAGYRVIAIENRGHGASDKAYAPPDYAVAKMATDARALLDYLSIPRAILMGYSMGARIATRLAVDFPARVPALVLGGLGIHLVEGVGIPLGIAEALEAADASTITEPIAQMFRQFAEANQQDLVALAACIRGSRDLITREEVAGLPMPTLIAVGTEDDIAGAPEPLAALIPDAEVFTIEGRDHNRAVGDRTHRAAVLAFLERVRGA